MKSKFYLGEWKLNFYDYLVCMNLKHIFSNCSFFLIFFLVILFHVEVAMSVNPRGTQLEINK